MTSPDCWSASSFPFIRRGLIRFGIIVSVQLRDSFFSSSLKNKRLLRNSLSVFRPFSRHYFLANVRIITLFYHLSPLSFLIHRISGPFFISQIDLPEGLSPCIVTARVPNLYGQQRLLRQSIKIPSFRDKPCSRF
jgi:hypothetical protein